MLLEGIDYAVGASMTMKRYRWGVGMESRALLEVCGVDGVRCLASLARWLAKREVTIQEVFPASIYRLAGALRLEQNDEWALQRRSHDAGNPRRSR